MASDNREDALRIVIFYSIYVLSTGNVSEQHVSSHIDVSTVSTLSVHSESVGNVTTEEFSKVTVSPTNESVTLPSCPDRVQCSKLGAECLDCQYDYNCTFGKNTTVNCKAKQGIFCEGESNFSKTFECRYCYQAEDWEQICTTNSTSECPSVAAPPRTYTANCSVKEEMFCLGRRKFYRKLACNWTSGYRWSTALALSITLGGFGVDRFYLGLWRDGIGKLFSFGGLGVWTLVDVILIATGYVGPADGSLYIF